MIWTNVSFYVVLLFIILFNSRTSFYAFLLFRFSAVFALPEGHLLSYFGLVPHGHVLDVPNAAIGVVYYLYIITLSPVLPVLITRLAAVAAMSASLILAYRLTQIGEICVLCWTTHVLNAFLLWSAFYESPSSVATVSKDKKRR
jgi:hypothetical protein